MLRNSILEKYFLIRKNTLYSYLYIYSFDEEVDLLNTYTLGIDIGSTTVRSRFLMKMTGFCLRTMNVILRTFRRHWQIILEKAEMQLRRNDIMSCNYRIRWTDTCESSGDSVCAGSLLPCLHLFRRWLRRQMLLLSLAEKMPRSFILKAVILNSE